MVHSGAFGEYEILESNPVIINESCFFHTKVKSDNTSETFFCLLTPSQYAFIITTAGTDVLTNIKCEGYLNFIPLTSNIK